MIMSIHVLRWLVDIADEISSLNYANIVTDKTGTRLAQKDSKNMKKKTPKKSVYSRTHLVFSQGQISTFYKIMLKKKLLKMLGVEYISYHACPNDSILYRREYADKEI